MHRLGLALSGGGFRATLFHLGMIRFLKEANVLPTVTHITSVSGGSILAAHLVQNWDRYNGSLKDFDEAAAELIRFVQLDIRNRVVRRFPLALPVQILRRLLLRKPIRQLTRTGLLEYHYEKYLFGDTCLFQLPERPRLSILATNLSEGCLCAFMRDGLYMQRRLPGQRYRFERIHTGLATVPMAVTASSAFPGFFPPMELQGQDVDADPGQFGRLVFTDGGVYDNLGVRMFRCLERSWMAREVRLERDDLADAERMIRDLEAARDSTDDSPLRRLAQMISLLKTGTSRPLDASTADPVDQLLAGLRDVLNHENLAREPSFASLSLSDPDAGPLMEAAQRKDGVIEAGEQLWLNRQLVDAAFRKTTGQPCFRSLNTCFDAVLVSDAGKQFKINNTRAGGLIATSMRATDIVMDRVWQLETDTFSGTPGFVFAPISRIVADTEDATASHPEVQRMTADIRTDLDRFTPLEISSLIRHGYCVGRSACRSRPDLFGDALPSSAPWDPFPAEVESPAPSIAPLVSPAAVPAAAKETRQSRVLQRSGRRRLWSTLLDYRDWVSFLYVPLLFPILVLLPYYGMKWYQQTQIAQQLIQGMVESNQDYALMSQLLQRGPIAPFTGMPVDEDSEIAAIANTGVEVIVDSRMLDLRQMRPTNTQPKGEPSRIFVYRRLRIRKQEATANSFVVHFRLPIPDVEVRTLNSRVPSVIHVRRGGTGAEPANLHDFKVAFDLSKIPVGDVIDLPIQLMAEEAVLGGLTSATFYVDDETGMLSYWVLLPTGERYQNFELLRYPTGSSTSPEKIPPAYQFDTLDGRVLAFALLNLKPGFQYEARWEPRPGRAASSD